MIKTIIILAFSLSLTSGSDIKEASSSDLSLLGPQLVTYQNAEEPVELQKLRQQLAVHKAKGNKLGMAEIYHRMGIWHKRIGQYQVAQQRFYQALVLLENMRHEEAIAFTCLQIGTTYTYQERYNEALHYLFRSKNIARKRSLTRLGRDLNQHIAFTYNSMGKYQEAHKYRQLID
ncbi:MAG: tetratricopeptide repeat protein [Bacteroidota bacterium]